MGNIIHTNFSDVLREKGIFAQGYGTVSKYAMLDTDLSLTAKAIYGYLCSLTSKGATAFPGRDTILHALDIDKATYYKHFKALTEHGYVSVEQEKGRDGQFPHNVYRIEDNPRKFADDPRYKVDDFSQGSLSLTGLMAAGYGRLSYMVMTDSRISVKAKGMYAYFVSFSGAGKVAFPSREKTLYYLKISAGLYQRTLKELEQVNYLKIVQRHENGRLGINDYYIITNPDAEEVINISRRKSKKRVISNKKEMSQRTKKQPTVTPDVQVVQKSDTVSTAQVVQKSDTVPAAQVVQKSDTVPVVQVIQKSDTVLVPQVVQKSDMAPAAQVIQKQDTRKQVTGKQDTQKQDMQKSPTIINNHTINSQNNNTLYQNQSYQLQDTGFWSLDLIDAMDKEELKEFISTEMCLYGMPQNYGGIELARYEDLVNIVVEALYPKRDTIRINGTERSRGEVADRLLELSYIEYQYVLERVAQVKKKISNPRAYYLTALFNAKEDYSLHREQTEDIG